MTDNDTHIYRWLESPDDTNHVFSADRPCWCRHRVMVSCTACEVGDSLGCWRCGGTGLVDRTPFDAGPFVVLHEDTTGLPASETFPIDPTETIDDY